MTTSRFRRLAPRVAFAFGVGLLTLVLAVAALELWASRRVERTPDLWATNVRLNHSNRPSSVRHSVDFLPRDPAWSEPFDQHTNAQGWFRDSDVSREKPKGTWRIFYVGDSFTECPVPPAQTIENAVEKDLQKKLDSHGIQAEVINTGTWSYSPTLYYINIRYFIRDYAPDAIVLCVDMTDDYDDWKYSFSTVYDKEGLPWAVLPAADQVPRFIDSDQGALTRTWLADVQLFLYRKSYFFNWLSRRSKPRYLASPGVPTEQLYARWSWCKEDWDPVTQKQAERTLSLVALIARYCKREGIRLAITGTPHWEQLSGPEGKPTWSDRPHRELERVARENGAGWIDSIGGVRPTFSGSKQNEFYYLNDMHLNPRGYGVWGEVHRKAVEDPRLGLLPEESYQYLKD